MTRKTMDVEPLLTPGEVAQLFRVGSYTVKRWANMGKLGPVVRTPGGQRRFREAEVRALLGSQDNND